MQGQEQQEAELPLLTSLGDGREEESRKEGRGTEGRSNGVLFVLFKELHFFRI